MTGVAVGFAVAVPWGCGIGEGVEPGTGVTVGFGAGEGAGVGMGDTALVGFVVAVPEGKGVEIGMVTEAVGEDTSPDAAAITDGGKAVTSNVMTRTRDTRLAIGRDFMVCLR